MWWLIILSVPVFYIYGLIAFILHIIRKSQTPKPEIKNNLDTQEQFTAKFILELETIQSQTPNKSLSDIINEYKQKLQGVVAIHSAPINTYTSSISMPSPVEKVHTEPISIQKDLSEAYSNWYSENAISLLLYVGAFFIVASASIFVGFQWETIGGVTKALVLNVLTVAFFATGLYCYRLPKIKTAGRVFVAISALLIPFCGLAWYNFVLKQQGVPFGTVWFATSVIALTTYTALAYYLKHTFYPYIISISALSLMFSIVNMNALDSDYYILFGILTAFILSMVSVALKKQSPNVETTFRFPLELSSQIMMPLVLVYGLSVAVADEKLFTLQGTISVLLASLFYLSDYLTMKRIWSFAAAQLLFPFAIIIFFNWQKYDTLLLLYVLSLFSLTDICLAYLFNKYARLQETDLSLLIGVVKLILLFFMSFAYTSEPIHYTIFALVTALAGILAAAIKKDFRLLGLTSAFGGIALFIYLNQVVKLTDIRYTSYLFMLIGIGCYVLGVKYKQITNRAAVYLVSAAGYLIIAALMSLDYMGTVTIINVVITIILTSSAIFFTNNNWIYAGNTMAIVSLITLLRFLEADLNYTPLIFTVASFAFFIIAQGVPVAFKSQYRYSALAVSIGTPLLFGFMTVDYNSYNYPSLESNSLMTAYAAICMTTLDAVQTKSTKMKYFASAVAMFTYLWQIKILHITETQVYTLPLGIYFMALAYLQRLKNQLENWTLLNYLGLFLVILPGVFQSFDTTGAVYALLLGVIGIVILSLGLSLNYRVYIYAGIAALVLAVLSQTYEYLSSLPRWIITGIVGLGFLGTATYLLMHRKEPPKEDNIH